MESPVFKRKQAPLLKLTEYPSNTCIKEGDDWWYVVGKFKKKIPTYRILKSWGFPYVGRVEAGALKHLTTARPLGFRDGTIVRGMDGTVYIISERKRRKITTPDVLKFYGQIRSEIEIVSDYELSLHEIGEDLA